jgi:hypothetical protein
MVTMLLDLLSLLCLLVWLACLTAVVVFVGAVVTETVRVLYRALRMIAAFLSDSVRPRATGPGSDTKFLRAAGIKR